MNDDERERNERRQRSGGEAEQRKLHGPLAEERRGQRHRYEWSVNGLVTLLNGETLT